MIKLCVFDLDGTLLDTITTITYYVNNALQNHAIDAITTDEAKKFVGDGARELIMRSLKAKAPDKLHLLDEILNEYKSAYDDEPLYLTEAYDGILDMVGALRARGVTLAVLSNKPNGALGSVVNHYFKNSFAVALGAREGVALKPDPTSLLTLIDELGVKPGEVMYIGDTNVDMLTGKSAGVGLTVGVSWGFRDREELLINGADKIVAHPREITELIL